MSRCFVGSDRHKNCYRKEAIVLPSNELVDQVEKKAVPRFVGKTKCSVLYLRERSEERLCRLIFVSGFFEEGSWTNRAWNVTFSDELHEKKAECCHFQVQSSWILYRDLSFFYSDLIRTLKVYFAYYNLILNRFF